MIITDSDRNLWLAVIHQALDDLTATKTPLKRSARAWFLSSNRNAGSFIWICDYLGLEPTAVRRRVYRGGHFCPPDLALQVLYALKFYIYLFFVNVLALVIVARWIRPFGFVVRYCFWIGVCPSGDSRRLTGVWKEESVVARGLKVFLTLVAVVFPIACAPQSQTHPLDTAPIPANARILEEPCSPLGAMMCGAVSILSGETAVERRSACIIYVEPSGRRVEQCGSLPASHP